MLSKTIDISDKKVKLSQLISEVLEGNEVILTRDNKPLARLIPITTDPNQPRTPGLHSGSLKMGPDFDEPISDNFWLGAA